jgi:hypothetical protein
VLPQATDWRACLFLAPQGRRWDFGKVDYKKEASPPCGRGDLASGIGFDVSEFDGLDAGGRESLRHIWRESCKKEAKFKEEIRPDLASS